MRREVSVKVRNRSCKCARRQLCSPNESSLVKNMAGGWRGIVKLSAVGNAASTLQFICPLGQSRRYLGLELPATEKRRASRFLTMKLPHRRSKDISPRLSGSRNIYLFI
jgi:hypothetical protein